MSEPTSRAPGTVDATRDDHTDDAIARMLDKPEQVLDLLKMVAALQAVRVTEGDVLLRHDTINVLYVREQAQRLLGQR